MARPCGPERSISPIGRVDRVAAKNISHRLHDPRRMNALPGPGRYSLYLRRVCSLVEFTIAIEIRGLFATNAPLVENLDQTFDRRSRVGQNSERDGT